MGSIYFNEAIQIEKVKINYLSPKIWRIMYLIKTNSVHHTSEKRIRTRSSVIPLTFLSYEIIIHTGNKWTTRNVNVWNMGFKFGELTWNRKYALFKSKAKKKKKINEIWTCITDLLNKRFYLGFILLIHIHL